MQIRHLLAAVGMVSALGMAHGALAQAESAPRSITVTAEGSVAAAPDMATIQLGVQEFADTAAEALAAANAAAAALLARAQEAGIAPRDVQTTGLHLNARWDHRPQDEGEPRIIGYEAGNMVTIRVRDLDSLGGLLDAAVSDGANTFNGLNFGFAEQGKLEDEARRRAAAEGLRKAQLYAEAAGVELGELRTLNEQGGHTPRPQMMMRAEMASDSDVPVAGGEVELS